MTMPSRLLSFLRQGKPCYGYVQGDMIVDLTAHFGPEYPTLKEVIAAGRLKELAEEAHGLPGRIPIADVTFLPPIPNPEKILCVGVNYPDRNAEYKDGQEAPKHTSLFVRFPRSFTGHNEALVRPKASEQLDYEGELVLIIGKEGRHIPREEVFEHIAAITISNEGSVRDWVRHGKFNVTQGKNFDASGSIGPWLVPFEGEEQIKDVRIVTRVNGEVRQDDRTSRMMFDFAHIVSYISTFTTLQPGDVILTGTPTGAGARLDPPQWLKPGDVVDVEIEGIGRLHNTIRDEV